MVLVKGTEQWSTLSARDSLPQTKFSRKIHHTSALARSVRQQREVCSARGEGRTVGNIIAQLITKLTGSCRQKAVLPTFLPDTAVSLGCGRTGSAETPTTLGTLVGGSRDACASPRASRSPHFPIARAGGCTVKSWYLSWRNNVGSYNERHGVSAHNVPSRSPASTREVPSPARGPAALGWVPSGRAECPGRGLLALWECFWTKGQGQGVGRRNPNWKLLGSLV